MSKSETYILGGYQTDFSRNWLREERDIPDVIAEVVEGILAATEVPPDDVGTGHVGNFAAELYTHQGHLGAFLVQTNRHLQACRPPGTKPPARRVRSPSLRLPRRSKRDDTTWRLWSASSR